MGYSLYSISPNCYPSTTVLMNKLDIHDEETLHEAETLVTFINASKLEQHPLGGAFGVAHYKAIHYLLCSDLYDWAGQIRRVNIGKKGARFTLAEKIECQAALIFYRLKECDCYGECKVCGCGHPCCIDWREHSYSHPAGHLCCLCSGQKKGAEIEKIKSENL